jgi:type II secretory pathway component PulK
MGTEARGLALISTLLLVGVLMVLVGGFFQINSMNLRTLGGVRELDRAQQARASGLDYAIMRLEGDTAWGVSTGTDRPLTRWSTCLP